MGGGGEGLIMFRTEGSQTNVQFVAQGNIIVIETLAEGCVSWADNWKII
jgi:hypothetical protein